jgi:hypothetical protein
MSRCGWPYPKAAIASDLLLSTEKSKNTLRPLFGVARFEDVP